MVTTFSMRQLASWLLLRLALASAALGMTGKAEARIVLTRTSLADAAADTKRHVDVLLSTLNDERLVAELSAMARSGRKIRVLTSSSNAAGITSKACPACTALEGAGATVRYLENPILDTYLIVDGPRTRFASGDRSEIALRTGRTDKSARTLIFKQEGDYVLAFQQEFDHLWSKALDYGSASKAAPVHELRSAGGPFVLFSSANMTPIQVQKNRWSFSPTLGNPTTLFCDYLVGAIDYAYSRIDIGAFDLERQEVLQALGRALARGVRVRVLLEDEITEPMSALVARGATVVSLARIAENGRTPRLPANVLVIDDKFAITGSFLWSRAAETKAFGSLVSLQGGVVASYRRWLDSGFAKSATRMPLK